MTAARSTLCAFSCALSLGTLCARAQDGPPSASQGAALVAPERAVVMVGGGMNSNFPTLSVGASAGLFQGVDLSLRYDTHAGLAHDLGLHARVRLAPAWALSLDATNSFYAFEEVAGIRAVDAPFGNGISSSPLVLGGMRTAGGTRLWAGAGPSVRFVALVEELGTLRREPSLSLRYARLVAGAEWPGDGGSTFLHFVANVPIEAEARVIGFFPWLTVGTTWELP